MKTDCWASSPEFLIQYVRMKWEDCISNKLLGDDAPGQGTTLWEPLRCLCLTERVCIRTTFGALKTNKILLKVLGWRLGIYTFLIFHNNSDVYPRLRSTAIIIYSLYLHIFYCFPRNVQSSYILKCYKLDIVINEVNVSYSAAIVEGKVLTNKEPRHLSSINQY